MTKFDSILIGEIAAFPTLRRLLTGDNLRRCSIARIEQKVKNKACLIFKATRAVTKRRYIETLKDVIYNAI